MIERCDILFDAYKVPEYDFDGGSSLDVHLILIFSTNTGFTDDRSQDDRS